MKKGLQVIFDGDKNVIVDRLKTFENLPVYPIGGVICEFLRFQPAELIGIVNKIPHFDDPWEEYFVDGLIWFEDRVEETFDLIPAAMIIIEFYNFISEYVNADDEYKDDVLGCYGIEVACGTDSKTGKDTVGLIETVGQLFLGGLDLFISRFKIVKSLIEDYVNEDRSGGFRIVGYERNADYQDIGYRIAYLDGTFHSIYKIKDSYSLLLFELAHILNNGTKIRKCKNCGNYFVPAGRSDAVYCSYPSPEKPNKACRDIGARNTRVKLEKNDIITREYRRLYKRLKAAISRHPGDVDLEMRLKKLTDRMKEMKNKRQAGIVSSDDILEWLYYIESDMQKPTRCSK